jgi:antitoxin component YwqK of YwqJK toxin-antitoxin module
MIQNTLIDIDNPLTKIGSKNNKLHGYWELYFTGNILARKGYYNNGNRIGYWIEYDEQTSKTYYIR